MKGRSRAEQGPQAWAMGASARWHPHGEPPVRGGLRPGRGHSVATWAEALMEKNRCRNAGPQRHRRGRVQRLGALSKASGYSFGDARRNIYIFFFQFLACVSSCHLPQITLWASIGRPGAANQVAGLACNSPGTGSNRDRVLLRSLEGLDCVL
jgi:hypothetical protein